MLNIIVELRFVQVQDPDYYSGGDYQQRNIIKVLLYTIL
jgi:hypothetical protein